MNQPSEDAHATRARQARQVLAGGEVRAPRHPLDFTPEEGLLNPIQRAYLAVLLGLLLIALFLSLVWSLGVASPVLLILAFALLAGWVVF